MREPQNECRTCEGHGVEEFHDEDGRRVSRCEQCEGTGIDTSCAYCGDPGHWHRGVGEYVCSAMSCRYESGVLQHWIEHWQDRRDWHAELAVINHASDMTARIPIPDLTRDSLDRAARAQLRLDEARESWWTERRRRKEAI